jgi:hypothetical protein
VSSECQELELEGDHVLKIQEGEESREGGLKGTERSTGLKLLACFYF